MIVMFITSYTIQCLTRRYLRGKQPRRRRNESSSKETFRIRNQDTSKCSKRCRQVRQLLKVKQRQKEEAMHIEDIERLITEIEMLKVVLYLVARISRSR
jgi:hypothetical protein